MFYFTCNHGFRQDPSDVLSHMIVDSCCVSCPMTILNGSMMASTSWLTTFNFVTWCTYTTTTTTTTWAMFNFKLPSKHFQSLVLHVMSDLCIGDRMKMRYINWHFTYLLTYLLTYFICLSFCVRFYLRRRLASEGIVLLGVTLSRCVCVRRAAYITYRLQAALVSATKVMRCIQCCLVFVFVYRLRWIKDVYIQDVDLYSEVVVSLLERN